MSRIIKKFSILTIILIIKLIGVKCTGRLLNPPSRGSAWREDSRFPIIYDDNLYNCGGLNAEWNINGGKCGICGEPNTETKNLEKGGSLYLGYIVRNYTKGSEIPVKVELTANKKGHFEFRICNVDTLSTGEATQECLDRIVLKDTLGRSNIPVIPGQIGFLNYKLQLPSNLACKRCVIQWKYHTGNSWGVDPVTGAGCSGCGYQEEYFGCSDVRIV